MATAEARDARRLRSSPTAEAADATRYLSLMLGLGVGEAASEPIHLLFAARRIVELLSERDPLLLVFEDVHWADDSLLDLIDYLIAHVHDHPVAFLALARPEFLEVRPTWGAGVIGQTTLTLEPLTAVRSRGGRRHAARGSRPGPRSRRSSRRRRGTRCSSRSWWRRSATRTATGDLPATVRAAIAARIDALPPDARTALLHASVIGQSFWSGVLDGMGDLGDVDDSLEALEARGLVRRRPQSQVEGDVEFAFKHVLIRDVAYATLPRGLRRELHCGDGAVHRGLGPRSDGARLGPRVPLARRWRARAGDGVPPRGGRSRARGASPSRRRTTSTRARSSSRTRTRTAGGSACAAGIALAELEQFSRADDELAALIPELDGREEIEAILARARSTFWTEQAEVTLSLAQRAAELAAASGAKELEAPGDRRARAPRYAMRGEEGDLDRAIELQDRALAMWVPGTRQLELAEQYHMQADNFYWTGDYPRALELSRLAASTGGLDPLSAEYVLRGAGMEGLILAGMGRYEEALTVADGRDRDGPDGWDAATTS